MLSVIVNHYRSPEVLKLALGYLMKNAPEGSEFIVTDSATIEKTERMMHYDFPGVTFLAARDNIGFAASVNRGIETAKGEMLLIANADVIVPSKTAIPELLDFLERHRDVGMVGPRLLNINGQHQPSCFRFYSPATIFARRTPFGATPWGKRELDRFLMRRVAVFDDASHNPLLVDWLMGSALLIRRTALADVGPLDERYFMYLEDVDWCRRFWEKGWQVMYYPHTSFYHYHFQASKKRGALIDLLTNRYTRTHLLSAVKYFKKFGLAVPRYGL